eukprot:351419_1
MSGMQMAVLDGASNQVRFYKFDAKLVQIRPSKVKIDLPFEIHSLHFIPGQKQLCVVDVDGVVRFYDTVSGVAQEDELRVVPGFRRCLISPGGTFLAVLYDEAE